MSATRRSLPRILAAACGALAGLLGGFTPAFAAMTFTTQALWRQLPVPLYHQEHGLTCEAAALRMALGEQGIQVPESTLMSQIGIDRRAPSWDGAGNMHWGDPYANFVGNPDGAERLLTGYGVYAPPIARVAQMDGATVVRTGEGIAPATLYQDVLAGHPAIAWVSFDWKFHRVSHYVAFDGRTVQFGSPYEHAVVIAAVTSDALLINNPWFGLQWISKTIFEPSYATFNNMAVVLGGSATAPGPPTAASTYQAATPAPQDTYHPLPPARILDTRDGTGGAPRAPIGWGATLDVTVLGQGSVPGAGVDAVVVNLTTTDTTTDGFFTLYPAGAGRPVSSSVNWAPGQTIANLVTVPVGVNGKVTVFNAKGQANAVMDVQGWYGPGQPGAHEGLFNGLTPARLLDTRNTGGALGQGAARDLQVTGQGGVPSSGVAAIMLNVTVTQPSTSSFVSLFPGGSTRPITSNVNFSLRQEIGNRVVVPVGAGGRVTLFNAMGSVHLVVDVSGWFTDASNTTGGSKFAAVTPDRILDTRQGFGEVPPGGIANVRFDDTTAIGVTAVVLNVTVASPQAPSFLTFWPGGEGQTLSSDLNYTRGETVANMVVARLGYNASFNFINVLGATQVVMDLYGYFGPVVPTA